MEDYGPGIWASCSSENSGMVSYAVSKNPTSPGGIAIPDCGTAYPGAMIGGGLAASATGFGGGSASRSQPGHAESRQFGSQYHRLRLIESMPPERKAIFWCEPCRCERMDARDPEPFSTMTLVASPACNRVSLVQLRCTSRIRTSMNREWCQFAYRGAARHEIRTVRCS
jgi:hypothetical protein